MSGTQEKQKSESAPSAIVLTGISKKCPKCHKILLLDMFWKNTRKGICGRCKECMKEDIKKWRDKNKEKVKDYLRGWQRAHPLKVRASNNIWKSNNKNRMNQLTRNWQINHPIEKRAHDAISLNIKKGNLVKKPCEVCGEKIVQAHHDDYLLPLEVRWLCIKHHHDLHKELRDLNRTKVKE